MIGSYRIGEDDYVFGFGIELGRETIDYLDDEERPPTPRASSDSQSAERNADPTIMLSASLIDYASDAVPNRFMVVIMEVDGSTSVPGYLIRREKLPSSAQLDPTLSSGSPATGTPHPTDPEPMALSPGCGAQWRARGVCIGAPR